MVEADLRYSFQLGSIFVSKILENNEIKCIFLFCVLKITTTWPPNLAHSALATWLWQLLATLGNFWQLLATVTNFGNFWQLLTTFGCFWQLLTAFGNFWQPLATFCQLLAFFGNFWQFLPTFYNFWQLLPAFGNF